MYADPDKSKAILIFGGISITDPDQGTQIADPI